MAGIDSIADAMQAQLQGGDVGKVISSHLAETFELHHHPAMPSDGVMNRSSLLGATGSGGTGALANAVRTMEDVEVDGDRIAVTSVLAGTLPDGEHVRVPNTAYYTIAGDEIVRIDSHYDDATFAALERMRRPS